MSARISCVYCSAFDAIRSAMFELYRAGVPVDEARESLRSRLGERLEQYESGYLHALDQEHHERGDGASGRTRLLGRLRHGR